MEMKIADSLESMQKAEERALKQIEEKILFLYVHMVDGGGQRSIMSARTKNFQLVAKVYERVWTL